MMEHLAFVVVAVALIVSALRVVTSKNLVHSVLWLGVTLASTAVMYLVLEAPFLAGVQILLYTGGVVTLMIFGVMLTRRVDPRTVVNEQSRRLPGAATAILTFLVLVAAALATDDLPAGGLHAPDTETLGRSFLTEHVMAFEVLSLLLLAAMVGAIVLARRRDYGTGKEKA